MIDVVDMSRTGLRNFYQVLDHEDHQYIQTHVIDADRWQLSSASRPDAGDPVYFWYLDLESQDFFTHHMLDKISHLTSQRYKILQVYANGQTHGQSGSLHLDTAPGQPPATYFTFLYYANMVWNPEWGGHTVFVPDPDHIHSRYPNPNSAVLFDSIIPHVGLEPTRHCTGMRVTVAFKLEILSQ